MTFATAWADLAINLSAFLAGIGAHTLWAKLRSARGHG